MLQSFNENALWHDLCSWLNEHSAVWFRTKLKTNNSQNAQECFNVNPNGIWNKNCLYKIHSRSKTVKLAYVSFFVIHSKSYTNIQHNLHNNDIIISLRVTYLEISLFLYWHNDDNIYLNLIAIAVLNVKQTSLSFYEV
jgi:hypothetical protein